MKLHRIYALKANVTQSPIAHLGARSYLQLDLDMTDEQRREAIFTLLGSMSEQHAYEWLKSEFPEWFEPPSAMLAAGHDPRQSAHQDQEDAAYNAEQHGG